MSTTGPDRYPPFGDLHGWIDQIPNPDLAADLHDAARAVETGREPSSHFMALATGIPGSVRENVRMAARTTFRAPRSSSQELRP